MAAERAVVGSLREEVLALEAHWSAQQAEAVARVTEQLEVMAAVRRGCYKLIGGGSRAEGVCVVEGGGGGVWWQGQAGREGGTTSGL